MRIKRQHTDSENGIADKKMVELMYKICIKMFITVLLTITKNW